jgi:hypothetical protein
VNRQLGPAFFALLLLAAAIVGLAGGCSADHSLVGGACAPGYTQCGDHCVNLDADSENCGVCGVSCPSGVACSLGECGGSGEAGAGDAADTGADVAIAPTDGASLDGLSLEGNDASGASGDATAPDAFGATDSSRDAGMSLSDGAEGSAVDSASTDGATADAPPNDGAASEASSNDAPSSDAAPSDDAGDGATGDDVAEEPLCTPPLADCGGVCIDTTMDPANCGGCGTTCYSGICQGSHCVGETTGSLIFIGHDYTTYSQAQARVLSNAVLLPQASKTIPVLSYERYASATPLANVKNIVGMAATNIGRTLVLTSTTTDSDVTSGLTIDKYGVLLVADQPTASPGDLAALGAAWMTSVTTFVQAGGVVVVLDSNTGVQEMPAFVTSTQLLSVTAQVSVPIFTQLDVMVLTDAVAQGVASPYAAGAYSASFTTEPPGGSVVYVVTTFATDASTSAPVVIHKVF